MFCYDKKFRVDFDNKFVGTERFSPVAMGQDLPHPSDPFHIPIEEYFPEAEKNAIVDQAWWREQRRRCLYGYRVPKARQDNSDVHITGRHYWYLNFWPIYGLSKDSNVKKIINPRFIDLDYEAFWEWQSAFALKMDTCNMKSRQKGFSEKAAGGLMGYNYTFFPDSVNIIVAGTEADADHTMENTLRGLNKLENTQFYKTRSINRSEYIKAKYFGSEIRSLTAKDNPQALSRFSPFLVYYEEVGKWKMGLVRAMKEFVGPSIVAEGRKTGFQFFIGTSGDLEAGAADLEQFYYNPIKEGLLDFPNINEPKDFQNPKQRVSSFYPRYLFTIVDKDGNSLYAESEKYHEKEEKKRTTEAARYLYRVNNPKYGSHAFDLPTGGYFDKEVIMALNEQRRNIMSNSDLQIGQDGHFEWNDPKDWSKGAYFAEGPNKDGEITAHVIETPKEGEIYGQSIDSYDRDESNTSDSKGSSTMFKGLSLLDDFSDTWVARITYRPDILSGGAKRFYEETVKMAIAYNTIEKVLVEYSNLRIFDYYETKGVEALLQERPDLAIASMIDKTKVANKYGIDPATKPHWLATLNQQLLGENGKCEPVRKILDLYILKRLAKFVYHPGRGKYNCDTTITCALNAVQRLQFNKEIEMGNQGNDKEFAHDFRLGNAYGFNN